MHMIHCLALDDADHIVESAKEMAQQLSARVSIAVVDASGVLLSFRRLDGASIASVETSAAKARTAALTGGDSAAAEQAIGSGACSPVVVAGCAASALRLDGRWTGVALSECGGGGDRSVRDDA